MAVAQITIGAILIVTGAGAGAGAGMIISGTVSLLSDELSQIMSGLGTISTGFNCIMVGLSCFTCPWGAVLGVIDIVVGAATVAVGVNDIATAITGRNFIRELTGMSEQAYFWVSLGLNIASSALTIASTAIRNTGKLCFVAGTGVLVVGANGVLITKNIEDIKAGDRVMTYNEETGYNEVKTVLETYTSEHTELVSVTTSDGQTIKSSLGHKYFTNRGWISAENLRAGDILQNVNGEQVIVEFIQHEILENPETLYNFAVEGNHNYYVSENPNLIKDVFILSHNNCAKKYELANRGHTGRTEPIDLKEQIVLEDAKLNPTKGKPLDLKMRDSRWPVAEGWEKRVLSAKTSDGHIEIHYVLNELLGLVDDFKIKRFY